MKALEWKTNYERLEEVASRFVKCRKALKITQKRLAVISGVSYGSIRRFEKTGQISLFSLICLATALDYKEDIENLFKVVKFQSFEDALKDD